MLASKKLKPEVYHQTQLEILSTFPFYLCSWTQLSALLSNLGPADV